MAPKRHDLWANARQICDGYKAGATTRQLASRWHCGKTTIRRLLCAEGVPRRPARRLPGTYRGEVNDAFFDEVTPVSAFVLGFWLADGCLQYNPQGTPIIGFKQIHPEILEYIRSVMGVENGVAGPDSCNGYALRISSNRLKAALFELCGFQLERKRRTAEYPRIQKYHNHFIRGLFAGDGCISVEQGGQLRFSLAGREILLREVQVQLIRGCDLGRTNIQPHATTPGSGKLAYGGNRQVPRIMDWLYEGADYLDPKWYKYLRLRRQ